MNDNDQLKCVCPVILPKNRTIGLVKIETIKLTETYEKNTTKIHS